MPVNFLNLPGLRVLDFKETVKQPFFIPSWKVSSGREPEAHGHVGEGLFRGGAGPRSLEKLPAGMAESPQAKSSRHNDCFLPTSSANAHPVFFR